MTYSDICKMLLQPNPKKIRGCHSSVYQMLLQAFVLLGPILAFVKCYYSPSKKKNKCIYIYIYIYLRDLQQHLINATIGPCLTWAYSCICKMLLQPNPRKKKLRVLQRHLIKATIGTFYFWLGFFLFVLFRTYKKNLKGLQQHFINTTIDPCLTRAYSGVCKTLLQPNSKKI